MPRWPSSSSTSSSSSPGVSVHADLALLTIDADAAVGVCTYALGRYRRRQERDNEDDNSRPTRSDIEESRRISLCLFLSFFTTMVDYYSDVEFRDVLDTFF